MADLPHFIPLETLTNVGWTIVAEKGIGILTVRVPLNVYGDDYLLTFPQINFKVIRPQSTEDLGTLNPNNDMSLPAGNGTKTGLPHMPTQNDFNNSYVIASGALPLIPNNLGGEFGGDSNFFVNYEKLLADFPDYTSIEIAVTSSHFSAFSLSNFFNAIIDIIYTNYDTKKISDFSMDPRGVITATETIDPNDQTQQGRSQLRVRGFVPIVDRALATVNELHLLNIIVVLPPA